MRASTICEPYLCSRFRPTALPHGKYSTSGDIRKDREQNKRGREKTLPLLRKRTAALPDGNASDQEVVLARLTTLGRRHHPARHAATASPGIVGVLWVAILRRHAALALAALAEHLFQR